MGTVEERVSQLSKYVEIPDCHIISERKCSR